MPWIFLPWIFCALWNSANFELTVILSVQRANRLQLRGRPLPAQQPTLWLAFGDLVLAVGMNIHPTKLTLESLPRVSWINNNILMTLLHHTCNWYTPIHHLSRFASRCHTGWSSCMCIPGIYGRPWLEIRSHFHCSSCKNITSWFYKPKKRQV